MEYTEQYEGIYFNPLPPHGGRLSLRTRLYKLPYFNPLPPHGGRHTGHFFNTVGIVFQSTPSTRRETWAGVTEDDFNDISIHSLHTEGDLLRYVHGGCAISISIHSLHTEGDEDGAKHCTNCGISIHSLHTEGDFSMSKRKSILFISIHSLHTEGDSKTAQESVFHFAYPCTILQKRMQKTTFCTRKNGFFRKKGEKFGAKPSASFCAPMIRTDTFPLNFSHRISGSSMSMVSFAPICSTFD